MSSKSSNIKRTKKTSAKKLLQESKKQIQRVRAYAQNVVREPSATMTSNYRHMGSAPYHDAFGPGERYEFKYTICSIARTGATSQSFYTSLAPNQASTIFNFPMNSGGTLSSLYVPAVSSDMSAPAAAYPGMNVWAPNMTYVNATYGAWDDCRPYTEYRYHTNVMFREVDFEYKPAVAKTVSGQLTFAPLRGRVDKNTHTEEQSFAQISSIPGAVTTAVCDGTKIVVLRDKDLSKASTYTPSNWAYTEFPLSNVQFSLLGAVKPTLPQGTSDELGTLIVHYIVDMYGAKWVADPRDGTTLLRASRRPPTEIGQLEAKEAKVTASENGSTASTVEKSCTDSGSTSSAASASVKSIQTGVSISDSDRFILLKKRDLKDLKQALDPKA
jgi:hypothetical protein